MLDIFLITLSSIMFYVIVLLYFSNVELKKRNKKNDDKITAMQLRLYDLINKLKKSDKKLYEIDEHMMRHCSEFHIYYDE
jgi:hypothetical protein